MGSTSTAAPPRPKRLAPDLTVLAAATGKTAVYLVGIIPGRDAAPAKDDQPAVEAHQYPPFHATDIGGVTFPESFTPWRGGDDPAMQRAFCWGALVEIDEAKFAEVCDELGRSVVRWEARSGRHAHGRKVVLETEERISKAQKTLRLDEKDVSRLRAKVPIQGVWRPRPDDEPLAKYVYMVKMPGAVAGSTTRPATIPPSVLEVGDIESP